jgi:nucleoside-diphosphate-sugar epimerase
MKALVTGSAGHLGEALVRTLRDDGHEVLGLDIRDSEFTSHVGSIADRSCVTRCMAGIDTVFHSATLHKPHLVTHTAQDFVDTNVTGTLVLLEAAVAAGVSAFVFTSTTSVFGDALRPPPGAPAAWVTEALAPVPKNIYGATKAAAEDLCRLFHRQHGLNCLVLRTSRFFPEEDDDPARRAQFSDANIKANEYLYRRVEIADVVSAHLRAAAEAPRLGHGRYIISATSPFTPEDLHELNRDAARVVRRHHPGLDAVYEDLDWRMFERIDRVYVNAAARRDLGWRPRFDFAGVLAALPSGGLPGSRLAELVGAKGYHEQVFDDGPYPVA